MYALRLPLLAAGLFLSAHLSAGAAEAYPHMHHALYELKEARTELKAADHDFGGHREKSLKAVDAAVVQIEKAFEGRKIKFNGGKPGKDAYKGYAHHPHIQHAVAELKRTRVELKEAAHDFGGHREKALKDVDYAIEQLELALKYAKK